MNYRCWPLPLLGMDQRVPLRWWEQEKMVRNWNDLFCNFQEFQRCFNRLFWRSIVVSTLTLKGRFIRVSFTVYHTLKLVWRWYPNCFLNYIIMFSSIPSIIFWNSLQLLFICSLLISVNIFLYSASAWCTHLLVIFWSITKQITWSKNNPDLE